MKRISLPLTLLALLAAVVASSSLCSAQLTPFYVHQGISIAEAKAKDTLAPDAFLVYAGAFGSLNVQDIMPTFPLALTIHFYVDSVDGGIIFADKLPGQSDAWGYVYY